MLEFSLEESVICGAFEQCKTAMESLPSDAPPKDRLSVVRAVTSLLEVARGKRTVVEHLHSGQGASVDLVDFSEPAV